MFKFKLISMIRNCFTKKHKILFIQLTFFVLIMFGTSKTIAKISNDDWQYVSKEVKEICNSVKNISIPPQELPHDSVKDAFKKCDSDELYFGFKNPPNYSNARNCAIINHDYDVLTMIYANGKDVKPDLDLAIHFACLFNGAPAEIESRVKHLVKLKEHNSEGDFNICDDVTSGYMMSVCASYTQRAAIEKQKKHLKAINQSLTSTEQRELKKLLKISQIYFNSRIKNEMDRFGTGAQAFMILEEISLNEHLIKLIDKSIYCKVELQTTMQFVKTDNELNILYKKIQQEPEYEFSGLNKTGIKQTERVWIKYKDAWISFGQTKCPAINKETWETLITQQRITQLKEFVRS